MLTSRFVPLVLVGLALALTSAPPAAADSTPVGPLPSGPTRTVTTERGSLIAVAVTRRKPSTGLVWRIARPLDARVVRQVSEADVDGSVVLVFRAIAAGRASIVLALTRGDSSPRAVHAVTYRVRVR